MMLRHSTYFTCIYEYTNDTNLILLIHPTCVNWFAKDTSG